MYKLYFTDWIVDYVFFAIERTTICEIEYILRGRQRERTNITRWPNVRTVTHQSVICQAAYGP